MAWWWLVLLVSVCCSDACPLWHVYNNATGECECGQSLGGIVVCDSNFKWIKLRQCYCMSYSGDFNTTVVGQCSAMCGWRLNEKRLDNHLPEYNVLYINDSFLLNSELCVYLNRDGQLCGRCADGYGPPVYSYSLECVVCYESDFRSNLLKYIAVAYLPLTVFYLSAIMFRLSVTSGSMVALILVFQLASVPQIQRIPLKHQVMGKHLLLACYSIWNLDFFRSLYPPFCIHPKLSTLHVLALDYLVGVYPLFLILLTYIAVTLHDRYPMIVKIWRPAFRVLRCIRLEWNIRGSLIQAFATFLVLSYVKILNVSFDLFTPVYLKTSEGKTLNKRYLYNDGVVEYFGSEHLPFGVLAVCMLVVFNILPVMLLLLYPCRWFRKCLSFCRLNSRILYIFMDAFQGCYRHTPRDCRYFAALYLLFRILNVLSFSLMSIRTSFALSCFMLGLFVMVLVFISPYKERSQNKRDAIFLILVVTSFSVLYVDSSLATFDTNIKVFKKFFTCVLVLLSLIPIMYVLVVLVCKLLPTHCLPQACRKSIVNEDETIYRFETEESPLLVQNL